MNPSELACVGGAMVAKGKGILAADESTGARLTALATRGRYASDMESRAA